MLMLKQDISFIIQELFFIISLANKLANIYNEEGTA